MIGNDDIKERIPVHVSEGQAGRVWTGRNRLQAGHPPVTVISEHSDFACRQAGNDQVWISIPRDIARRQGVFTRTSLDAKRGVIGRMDGNRSSRTTEGRQEQQVHELKLEHGSPLLSTHRFCPARQIQSSTPGPRPSLPRLP